MMKISSKKAIRQLKRIEQLIPLRLRLAADWPKDWEVLISIILSARTRDETTIKVCEILFDKFNSPKKLGKAHLKEIIKIIKSINYYKTKAKNIKETAILISLSGIPKNVEELIKLPGVGRKTANVYLAEFHKKAAIGVDTHLSFVSQSLLWSKNKLPEKIEQDLQKLFPLKYWSSLNRIIVKFGRAFNRKKQIEILNKIKLI
jgi:endonuclease III